MKCILNVALCLLAVCFFPFATASSLKTVDTPYVTPDAFMDLYYDFSRNENPNAPKDQVGAAQLLQNTVEKNATVTQGAPLVLIMNSTLYVYDSNRNLKLKMLMRTAPDEGFYEMTAISHIGPALAYLAKVHEMGAGGWKENLKRMQQHIKSIQTLNNAKKDNWITKVNAPGWAPFHSQIHNLVDYACSMSDHYIEDALSGKNEFNLINLQEDLFDGNKDYPIPFDDVMVGTFMLTSEQSMTKSYVQLNKLKLDWSKAKVIVRTLYGGNATAGVSSDDSWVVPFIVAASNNTLPKDRIFVAPYAEVLSSLGQPKLSKKDFGYYDDLIWGQVYNRIKIGNDVFKTIPSIYVPGRPAIPGDFGFTKASNINDFIIRLKYSLTHATENLSNTVGFWLPGELASKNWDVAKIDLPGVNIGFPKDISSYPSNNPKL